MNNTKDNLLMMAAIAATIIAVYLIIKAIRRMKQPVNPVTGKVTSPFGKRNAPVNGASTVHNGVDISVPEGTIVRSPWDGHVSDTYTDNAGGLQMIVVHNNGYRTGYAHLSGFIAEEGDIVKAGDAICRTGNSGNTTGPHLHFTLTDEHGAKINPETVFNFA